MPVPDAEQEVWRRVRERGRITVAEFMDVALYWPNGGYYTRPGRVGAGGDFTTAPSTHPAFAAALAALCFQAWTLLDRPRLFHVVELGAGDGTLCRDFVTYAQRQPEGFAEALRYVCVDLSPAAGKERGIAAPPVLRLAARGAPLRGLCGCVLSNELLDAMPVHVLEGCEGGLREQYVTEAVTPGPDGIKPRLVTSLGELSTPELTTRLAEVGVRLESGQRAEVRLGLRVWMAEVASALDRGLVITIDYGDVAKDLYTMRRPLGTLTAYYQHVQVPNICQRPGRQDLTAHVDFTALEIEGRAHGLDVLGFTTQREFLERLAVRGWSDTVLRRMREVSREGAPARAESEELARMAALVDAAGMGSFKVLVQGKGLGGPLWVT